MTKSNIGNAIGNMRKGGLSSRSPKDNGDVSVKPKSGPVVGARKANNKRSMSKGKGC